MLFLSLTKSILSEMNRGGGGGLVQRRVARVASLNNSTSNSNENEISNMNGDYDDSSKETRFTLMEEVLLLGLKEKEVSFLHSYLNHTSAKHFFVYIRVTLRSGMIVSLLALEDAS